VLNPEQITTLNVGTRFLRAQNDNERNCVELPDGRQVYVYVDSRGVLTVSVHPDAHNVQDRSLRVKIGTGEPVYEEVTCLPAWEDLPEVDKGAAIIHAERAEWYGDECAAEFYAPMFRHARLACLATQTRARYARQLIQDHSTDLQSSSIIGWLGHGEYERLTAVAYADAHRSQPEGDRSDGPMRSYTVSGSWMEGFTVKVIDEQPFLVCDRCGDPIVSEWSDPAEPDCGLDEGIDLEQLVRWSADHQCQPPEMSA
jgi:hypothetical protein